MACLWHSSSSFLYNTNTFPFWKIWHVVCILRSLSWQLWLLLISFLSLSFSFFSARRIIYLEYNWEQNLWLIQFCLLRGGPYDIYQNVLLYFRIAVAVIEPLHIRTRCWDYKSMSTKYIIVVHLSKGQTWVILVACEGFIVHTKHKILRRTFSKLLHAYEHFPSTRLSIDRPLSFEHPPPKTRK